MGLTMGLTSFGSTGSTGSGSTGSTGSTGFGSTGSTGFGSTGSVGFLTSVQPALFGPAVVKPSLQQPCWVPAQPPTRGRFGSTGSTGFGSTGFTKPVGFGSTGWVGFSTSVQPALFGPATVRPSSQQPCWVPVQPPTRGRFGLTAIFLRTAIFAGTDWLKLAKSFWSFSPARCCRLSVDERHLSFAARQSLSGLHSVCVDSAWPFVVCSQTRVHLVRAQE